MLQPYSSIKVHPELCCVKPKYPKGILYQLIQMLNENVFPYIKFLIDYDVVGNFHGEFLKYTGEIKLQVYKWYSTFSVFFFRV